MCATPAAAQLPSPALLQDSIAKGEQALQAAQKTGDVPLQIKTLIALATTHFYLHEAAISARLLEQADTLARTKGGGGDQGAVLSALALLHEATGDKAHGRDEARAAGGLFQQTDQKAPEALARMTEGRLDMALHDVPAAIGAYERARALFQSTGLKQGEAMALLAAGQANLIRNETAGFEAAAADLAQAAGLFDPAAQKFSLSYALWGLGTANDRLNRPAPARDAYARALPLFDAPKDRPMRARILRGLADDERLLGRLSQARDDYLVVVPLLDGPDDGTSRGLALTRLGDVRRALGDTAGAEAAYKDAAATWQSINDTASEVTALLKLGDLQFTAGTVQPAMESFGQALQKAQANGNPGLQATALMGEAGAYQRQGDYRRTREAAARAAALLPCDADALQRSVALLVAGDAAGRLHESRAALHDLDQVIALGATNPGGKAGALAAEAEIYAADGAPQHALALLQQAQDIDLSWHNDIAGNKVRDDIATTFVALGRMQEALAADTASLDAARASGNRQQQAATLGNLAQIRQDFGDTRQAVDLYLQAIEVARQAGDRDTEGVSRSNLGMAYHALGDDAKALETLTAALATARTLGNTHEEAITLNNLALFYNDTSEPQKALDTYDQVRTLFDSISDTSNEAITLSNIGSVYSGLGAGDRARTYFQQALTLDEKTGDRAGQAIVLNNLAVLQQEAGEPRAALRLYGGSLAIAKQLGNRIGQASLLSSMGTAWSQLGDHAAAKQALMQSQAIAHETADYSAETYAVHNLGIEYEQTGDLKLAAETLQKALLMWRRTGNAGGEATALAVLSRITAKCCALEQALSYADQSIQLGESQRSRVGSEELRATLIDRFSSAYAQKISVLMQLDGLHPGRGFAARAFETSEQARARSLLDLLAESHEAPPLQSGDSAADVAQERAIEQAMSAKSLQRAKLSPVGADAGTAAQLDHEIDALLASHERIAARIRDANPNYAALTKPKPLDLAAAQHLLDPGTVLLEYALGDQYSAHGTLWAVSDTGLHAYALPPRATIAAAVRALQDALPDVADPGSFDRASEKLGALLLGPVAGALGRKRLIIVGDGVLQSSVPFAALAISNGTEPPRKLLLDHEILQEPSASAIDLVRRGIAGRVAPPGAVAVLADPVFSASDPRLGRTPQTPAADVIGAVARSVTAQTELPRLTHSREEAASILKLAPPGASLARLDFDASKAQAEAALLGAYKIVHFATHGVLDQRHPALSGLVFSLFRPDGTATDGYLRLDEIFNLSLPVELVVLSACESGQGKLVGGEGLVGITRGFLYAGAARLTVSLWDVDDAATAALMADFYGGMFGHDHLSPAAALRRAQIAMLKNPKWQHPYFWAPFIAEGEWR